MIQPIYDVCMDPLEELDASLEDRVAALPERKRKMMRLRLGLADGRQWDLREIAREFDTDRDEVRAVEAEFFGD
jgi:RNA polymerase primary sigma factor